MGLFKNLIRYLYPLNCSFCENYFIGDTNTGEFFCSECSPLFESKHNSSMCLSCGEEYFSEESQVCPICKIFSHNKLRLRSVTSYTPQIRKVIKLFKYKNKRLLADYFANILVSSLIEKKIFPKIKYDLIIPVPSSSLILRKRGYSHSALIAQRLSQKINIPYSLLALQRIRECKAQARLKLKDRKKNVELSFICHNQEVLGKDILLIDDVITTGATIFAAADALFLAGSQTIDVLTVARSSNFSKNRLKLEFQ